MSKHNRIIGIIPARYLSTRFPGKPLIDIQGTSMIMRVYEKALLSACEEVIIATDDLKIYDHAIQSGAKVQMTNAGHPSGTDRCAEVASHYSKDDIIVNIQGDEPFISPDQLNELINMMLENPDIQIGTQYRRITDIEQVHNPNIVKLVKAEKGKCLYFSRSPIPFIRGTTPDNWLTNYKFYQHIGLYAFRQEVLMHLKTLPVGTLETAESLEQLRWLEAGYSIYANETEHQSIGIDVPEDLEKAIQLLKDQ